MQFLLLPIYVTEKKVEYYERNRMKYYLTMDKRIPSPREWKLQQITRWIQRNDVKYTDLWLCGRIDRKISVVCSHGSQMKTNLHRVLILMHWISVFKYAWSPKDSLLLDHHWLKSALDSSNTFWWMLFRLPITPYLLYGYFISTRSICGSWLLVKIFVLTVARSPVQYLPVVYQVFAHQLNRPFEFFRFYALRRRPARKFA